MNPQAQPAATPVPIHDIVGPVAFFPYPLWMVALAALGLLAVLALIGWLIFRRKSKRPLSPSEKALAALARLRGGAGSADPYEFSVEVSDVLRTYLRDGRGLSATTQTSREFLDAIRGRPVFNEAEKEALASFLEKADLIKFARLNATGEDCAALLDQAERLVRSRPEPVEGAAK